MTRFFLSLLAVILVLTCLGSIPPAVGVVALLTGATVWGMLEASVLHMTTRNLSQNIGPAVSFYPQVVTADAAKDIGIGTVGYDAVAFIGISGAIAAAGLVKLVPQECDTVGGSYTDVAAADLEGAFVNFAANEVQKVGYRGTKPFVALRADYTSGTSVAVAGLIERSRASLSPVGGITINS